MNIFLQLIIIAGIGWLLYRTETIMTTMLELEDRLDAADAKLTKISTETSKSVELIAELKEELESGGNISAAAEGKLAKLEAHLTSVDELVTDDVPVDPVP